MRKKREAFLALPCASGFQKCVSSNFEKKKKSLKIRISDRFGARDTFSDVGARWSNALRNSLVCGETLPLTFKKTHRMWRMRIRLARFFFFHFQGLASCRAAERGDRQKKILQMDVLYVIMGCIRHLRSVLRYV